MSKVPKDITRGGAGFIPVPSRVDSNPKTEYLPYVVGAVTVLNSRLFLVMQLF